MSGPNYTKWIRKAFWHLDEGVALLLGADPNNVKELRNRTSIPQEFREFLIEFHDMLDTAERSEGVEYEVNLPSINNGWRITYAEVKPTVFLKWAKEKGYRIPSELKPVLSWVTPDEQQGASKWGYQHDTKLLKIARDIIEQYWEEKDPNSAPSKEAIIAELKETYPAMSDSEAKAIDLITRHDKLRKTKL